MSKPHTTTTAPVLRSIEAKSPIWHPFTQMQTAAPPLKVVRGYGEILELENGKRLVDLISSWWVNIHGHAHPDIAKAIYDQALQLEHVIFAGFTHEPAEKLAVAVLSYLPANSGRVFFSDNGSTAVEAALKIACQFWWNQGQNRTKFITFNRGYYGDTIGAMSLGAVSEWWSPFRSLMFSVDTVSFPATFQNDPDVEEKEHQSIREIVTLFKQNPHHYAAIFIEPLVQGVGGMHMCRPQFLETLEKAAHEHDVLLIYDEVMTGFGRTGDWFACLKAKTNPDIVCLSKGLSGGFLPLALTITTDRVYQAFLSNDHQKAFLHGHSYTANPLACAAALASFRLLEENSNLFKTMEQKHRRFIELWLDEHPRVKQMRICGTIAAFKVDSQESDYFHQLGPWLKEKFIEKGVLIRPLGNTIYLMPPYCISDENLELGYRAIREVLDELEQ